MAGTTGIRAGRAFVELGVDDKLTAGLKRAQRQLQTFATGLRSAGLQLTGIAAAVGAPAAVATKTFADFEYQMARVRALTGANRDQFDKLTAEARRLGEMTIFTAKDAADAMSFFALAGYKVDQILAAIGPTLDMAAAGQIGIAESADIAAKIMAGMGIEADHLGEAVDVLTKAMTTANTDLRQLGDAMKYVGPIAKSAGIGFEEIVGTVQMLSNAGIQADMAGTTLRGALLSLTDPSKEAADQLRAMGVSVMDSQGNVRSLADIIDDMNRSLEGLGTGQRLGIIGRIFDARQAAGFAELLSQGGDKLREFTASLKDAKGTAGRIAGIQLDTLKGDVIILESAAEGLQISLGKVLGPMLRGVTQYATKLVTALSQWVSQNTQLIRTAALIVAGVGALGVGLLTLSLAVTVAAKALGGLAFITGTAVKTVGLILTVLTSLLSPIGLVIAAVAALGTAILVYTGAAGQAVDWLSKQFGRMKDAVMEVTEGISNALAAGDIALAAKILWLSLKLMWQEGVTALQRVWLAGKRFFVGIFHDMWFGALNIAADAWHDLKSGWIKLTAFLSDTWTRFSSRIAVEWATVTNLATKAWNEIKGLFDEDFDVQAANLAADRALIEAEQRINQEKDAALAELDTERQRKLSEEQSRYQARQREIVEQDVAASRALDAETNVKLAKTRADLEQARKELDAALAQARQKRPDQPDENGPGGKGGPLAGLKDQLAGLGDLLAAKASVIGTFNVSSTLGLQAGGAQDRIASATERTAKGVEDLRKD
ncbi:MAG: phage tail tape measure protein, partial [Planctomycetes bacterium]|nr:phage tail tape measure protein [Planctomycetota bacterium]